MAASKLVGAKCLRKSDYRHFFLEWSAFYSRRQRWRAVTAAAEVEDMGSPVAVEATAEATPSRAVAIMAAAPTEAATIMAAIIMEAADYISALAALMSTGPAITTLQGRDTTLAAPIAILHTPNRVAWQLPLIHRPVNSPCTKVKIRGTASNRAIRIPATSSQAINSLDTRRQHTGSRGHTSLIRNSSPATHNRVSPDTSSRLIPTISAKVRSRDSLRSQRLDHIDVRCAGCGNQ